MNYGCILHFNNKKTQNAEVHLKIHLKNKIISLLTSQENIQILKLGIHEFIYP